MHEVSVLFFQQLRPVADKAIEQLEQLEKRCKPQLESALVQATLFTDDLRSMLEIRVELSREIEKRVLFFIRTMVPVPKVEVDALQRYITHQTRRACPLFAQFWADIRKSRELDKLVPPNA